jgi:hypothetical protein
MRRMAGEINGRLVQIQNYAYAANTKAFDALLRRIDKNGGPVYAAEQKEQLRQNLLDPSKFVMQVSAESTLAVLKAADKLAPILFQMKWTIARPLAGFFITSDNPLIKEVDPKTRHPIYGDHGFRNKTAEVIYPLSPTCLLLMSWDRDAPDFGFYTPEHVSNINRALAANADRSLYSHLRTQKLMQLAAEYKDQRPDWTTEGFGPDKFAQVEVARRLRS